MHKVELLVEVATVDMAKAVIHSGCDAVFIGNEVNSFSDEELRGIIEYVHSNNKKIYVAFNKIPHEKDILNNKHRLVAMEQMGVDAVVINEPGMVMIIKEIVPNMEIQLGEEANITNYETAKFWYNEGIKRVVVSKELSSEEIGQIRVNTPMNLDIEVLVHGPMQISHSGRKLLSNFISNKLSNEISEETIKKNNYSLMEEKRPGLYFPISEDDRGTFLYNTEDLCMIEHLPELIKSGVTSFKINSKFRSEEYMSRVVSIYKKAMDNISENPNEYGCYSEDINELLSMNKRVYTTAFYLDNNNDEEK